MHREDLHGDELFVVHSFLSEEECSRLIARVEAEGPRKLESPGGPGTQVPESRAEVELHDPELAGLLWERTCHFLPEMNPARARLVLPVQGYRYDTGQSQAPRSGGLHETGEEQPLLILQVFLNGDFEGGETVCYLFNRLATVRPEPGLALFLAPHLTREELAVRAGRKYLLEAQVRPKCSSEKDHA
jgi:hypothetical protein